jgi:EmrB/QacA subfamily drug resistance transporter
MTAIMRPEHERHVLAIMICLSLGAFMSTLDTSIVSVSLPSISRDLSVSPVFTSWILIIYLIFNASFLLSMGSLGDKFGHRRVLIAGFSIFTIASLLSVFVPDLWALLFLQAAEGLGGGIILAISPALIATLLPESRKGQAFGLIGAFVSVALIAGPVLGGYITGSFNWHGIFLVNVPVGMAATALVLLFIPNVPPMKRDRFDYAGAVLMAAALCGLLACLSLWGHSGPQTPYLPYILILSLIIAVLFLWHEMRTPAPMMPLHLFLSVPFSASVFASFTIMAVYGGLLMILPFFFQGIWKLSPEQTGYMVVAASAGLMIASILSGRSVDRAGYLKPIIIATCTAIAGALLFLFLGMGAGVIVALSGLFLFGAGAGGFYPPNISLVMRFADKGSEGAVSGTVTTMRFLGQSVGIALFGAVFVFVSKISLSGPWINANVELVRKSVLNGFTAVFLIAVLFLAICLVLVLFTREPPGKAADSYQ